MRCVILLLRNRRCLDGRFRWRIASQRRIGERRIDGGNGLGSVCDNFFGSLFNDVPDRAFVTIHRSIPGCMPGPLSTVLGKRHSRSELGHLCTGREVPQRILELVERPTRLGHGVRVLPCRHVVAFLGRRVGVGTGSGSVICHRHPASRSGRKGDIGTMPRQALRHDPNVRQPSAIRSARTIQTAQAHDAGTSHAQKPRDPSAMRTPASDDPFMLHDGQLCNAHDPIDAATGSIDRRDGDRAPFPAEMTLRWLHDPETLIRFQILDVSDGGYRLRTRLPIRAGTTGIAVRLLPRGEPLEHAVVVVWMRPTDDGAYEIGLQRVGR